MVIQKERVRALNKKSPIKGPILYFMDRDRRLRDNWALLHAQNLAVEAKVPLHIIYVLPQQFLASAWRQHHFMIEGLKEVEEGAKKFSIRFEAFCGDPGKVVLQYAKKHKIGSIVTDFTPLKLPRHWRSQIAQDSNVLFEEVDTHNIIPCWHASPKQEFAAYTIRPKIHKKLPEFLVDIPKLKKHPYPEKAVENNWEKIIKQLDIDHSVKPVSWITPGEKAAKKAMQKFLETKLEKYSDNRNDPTKDAISNLSPYFHYGQISAQRLAFEAQKYKPSQTEAFLEELIVRRELADNFCYYNHNYDSVKGFPAWATHTLKRHIKDKREYIYNLKTFEQAKTHDPLWNAAQNQMLQTGKMHGYMRMYWCKKILEWTKSPKEAMKIAIYLNDHYELDGRDPNGYTGIAWSIGGVHDRAWFERPIFGKIRYMNFNGCKRKFDIEQYINTWNT